MNLPLTRYGGMLGAYLKPQRSRQVRDRVEEIWA